MTDTEPQAEDAPEDLPPRSRSGLFIGLGAAGVLVLAAIVTAVLMTALGVLGSNGLSSGAARRALLTGADVTRIPGVRIAKDAQDAVRTRTLQEYVRANPGDTSRSVKPANCADNLEGWMAWKSLDTPAYRGWKTDTIYAATNIVVDSTVDFENGLQEARHFATVGQATAFMSAQRGWYRTCADTSYTYPQDPSSNSAFHFTAIPLNLGLDSVVERSNNKGQNLPPHVIDVYLRRANIVYVSELVTTSAPQHGLDAVSLAIIRMAAHKLGSLN